jgi:hypothetical protein
MEKQLLLFDQQGKGRASPLETLRVQTGYASASLIPLAGMLAFSGLVQRILHAHRHRGKLLRRFQKVRTSGCGSLRLILRGSKRIDRKAHPEAHRDKDEKSKEEFEKGIDRILIITGHGYQYTRAAFYA